VGPQGHLTIAAGAGLAPWFCWSERAVGTNGMGTALETQNPVVIRREEHWCQAFHDWTCVAVAVRDVVSKEPIAVLNISCWRSDLPRPRAGGWRTPPPTPRADCACAPATAAPNWSPRTTTPGQGQPSHWPPSTRRARVVIADDTASVLLGVPGNAPAVNPVVRWNPRLPAFVDAARYASRQASRNPDWIGSTQIFTHLADEPTPIGICPVFQYGNLVGHLISFGVPEGEPLPDAEVGAHSQGQPRRVVGVRESRMVLLRLPEVTLAESEGNEVWLSTDQGRLRATSSGLDKLDTNWPTPDSCEYTAGTS
jgi:Transcriptional activator of acetoin/glycerol metabolism